MTFRDALSFPEGVLHAEGARRASSQKIPANMDLDKPNGKGKAVYKKKQAKTQIPFKVISNSKKNTFHKKCYDLL